MYVDDELRDFLKLFLCVPIGILFVPIVTYSLFAYVVWTITAYNILLLFIPDDDLTI